MEYRGFECVVLQTIPKGWRWTVKRQHSEKSGTADSRQEAVARAQMFIDGMLQRQERAAKIESGLVVKRQYTKRKASLKDRLAAFAKQAQDRAAGLRPSPERDALLKQARQTDTAAHIDEWARSPGLRPPK
jgi:hypothetical protein